MRRHPLAIALAAGSLLALSAPAPAQPAPFPTTRDRIPVISLNFPGGTVEKYIAALRDAAGTQGANIVVSKAALGVELAPIQLTGAQLPAAVQALRAAAGVEAGSWDIQEVPGTSNGQGVVMTVDFRAPKASRQSRDDSDLQRLEIISIKQIVEALPGDPPGANIECRPEVVLSAVEAAVSLGQQKAEGEPEVKYHPDSGLLIVRAGPTTMRAAIEAVSAIRDDVKRRRELAHSFAVSPTAMIEAEAAFKRAEAQYRTARDQTEAARDRYRAVAGQAQQGQASTRDMADARAAVAGAEGAERLAMIEQERAAEARRAVQPAADTEPGTMIYDCSDLAKGRPEVFAVLRAACDAVCKASRATVDVRASDKEAVFTVSGTKGAVARVDDVMKRMFDGLRADPTLAPKAPGR